MYTPFNRGQNRKLAIIFIALGLLLAPDIVVPTPGMDILINIPLAMIIADLLSWTFLGALMFTYVFSFILIVIGLLIFPYNTQKLISARLKRLIQFSMSHPLLMIASIIIFILLLIAGSWFYDNLYQYAKSLAV